jgi:hypothetical protein
MSDFKETTPLTTTEEEEEVIVVEETTGEVEVEVAFVESSFYYNSLPFNEPSD